MRVLYHHRILAQDGMQVHVTAILAALRRQGHEVLLVGPTTDAERQARPSVTARLGAVRSRLPRWMAELMELAYNLKAYRSLVAARRTFAADVIYERYNLYLIAGIWFRRRSGLPLLLEVNAPLYAERCEHGGLSLRRLARWTETTAWRNADVVLPVSHALAEHIRAAGVPDERIVVIPNGADPALFAGEGRGAAIRERLGLGGKVVFGFVGFARPWHGLDRVLDVFVELDRPELHLVIVGDGLVREALTAEAERHGILDRLTFTGDVPHDDVPAYLEAFDVALQPDVTSYASPLKLLEYMAAGCAIVAPDRSNIRELVADGDTALLFDPADQASFAAAIRRLAFEPALREALGRRAAAAIAERGLTWDGNAARIVGLARSLADRRRAPAAEPDAARP